MTDDGRDRHPTVRRRTLLAGLGGLAGLAGCGGRGATSTRSATRSPSPTPTTSPTETSTPSPTPSPTPRPTAVDTDWPAHFANERNTGAHPDGTGPREALDVAWHHEADEVLAANPVVADGTVFAAGDRAGTVAVEAATGTELWHEDTRVHDGMAVAGDVLYAGTVPGEVVALDAATGKERWAVELGDLFAGAPTVIDGTVFACCENTVAALDAETGERRWTRTIQKVDDASPAVAGGRVYVGTPESMVHALDADSGETVWTRETGGSVHAGPSVAHGRVYVPAFGGIEARDAATGDLAWEAVPPGSVVTPPVVTEDVVVVGQGSKVAYDVDTGEEQWRYDDIGWASSDGTPAAATADTVYASGPDGNLHAIDIGSGEPRFVYDVDGDPEAAPVPVDGVCFVTDSAWRLVALAEVAA